MKKQVVAILGDSNNPARVIFNPESENPALMAVLRQAGISVEEAWLGDFAIEYRPILARVRGYSAFLAASAGT